jgi:hypothetical protein
MGGIILELIINQEESWTPHFAHENKKNGGNSPFSLPPQAPDCLLILLESTLMIFT